MHLIAILYLSSAALADSAGLSESIAASASPDAAWGLVVMSLGLFIYAGCLSYRDKYLRR